QHGNEALLPRGTELEAVISGDVLVPRDAIAAAQPKPAERRPGPALVTFYCPHLKEGANNTIDVWCGVLKVGKLKRVGQFALSLPGGKYWFRLWNSDKSPIATLNVEDGTDYYVRVGWTPRPETSSRNYRESIVTVLHDIGELQSVDTVKEKSRDVQDPNKLTL